MTIRVFLGFFLDVKKKYTIQNKRYVYVNKLIISSRNIKLKKLN